MLLQIQNSIALRVSTYCQPDCEPTVTDIGVEDVSDFAKFLVGLDEGSRRSLFGHVVSDGMLQKHAETAIHAASKVIGIFTDDQLRGVLEAYSSPNTAEAEIAIVVHQGWRRRGLGTALLRAAQGWASANQLGKLRLRFSRQNWPMRHLAQKADARLDIILGEMCADILVGRTC